MVAPAVFCFPIWAAQQNGCFAEAGIKAATLITGTAGKVTRARHDGLPVRHDLPRPESASRTNAYRRITMRLPVIPRDQLTAEQQPLFELLSAGIKDNLQGFTTQTPDGSLIGPFSVMLHYPAYGRPVWDLFLALNSASVLPKGVREVVILSTAARFGSMYELYSHEAVAARSGLAAPKIRTIAAGERPAGLTDEESIAYDVTAVLLRGHQVPNSAYDAAVAAFGVQGIAEIAYTVGCYCMVSAMLNAFDVNLPGTELG